MNLISKQFVSSSELMGQPTSVSLLMGNEPQSLFQNRKYVVDTLSSWLKQSRLHQNGINDLITWLEYNRLRGHYHICFLISEKVKAFTSIAPEIKSPDYFYYKTIILPILQYCSNESNKPN